MVRKQVKALTVLYLVPCQHFGVYFAPYQILLVMGAVFVLLAIPFLLFYDRTVLPYATDACRGTGKSEGYWEPNVNERPDGRDTLQWLNDQPWAESIGYFGAS